jgi:hypothetical protein
MLIRHKRLREIIPSKEERMLPTICFVVPSNSVSENQFLMESTSNHTAFSLLVALHALTYPGNRNFTHILRTTPQFQIHPELFRVQ